MYKYTKKSLIYAGVLIGHIAFDTIYLVGSLVMGTPNPLGWADGFKERQRETQEYNQLYNEPANCVERLNPDELNDLTRVGIDFNFDSRTGQAELPMTTRKKLETVVQGCEPKE